MIFIIRITIPTVYSLRLLSLVTSFHLYSLITPGKEVAKFVKLKYVQVVLDELASSRGDVAQALRESFHRVDELLEDMVRLQYG